MSVETLTGLITGGVGAVAVLGILLALILAGKLHTDSEMRRADEMIERQARALDKSEEALAETRRALAEASARADAAVRSSEVIASALQSAGRQHTRRAT